MGKNPDLAAYEAALGTYLSGLGRFSETRMTTENEATRVISKLSADFVLVAQHLAMNGTSTSVYKKKKSLILVDQFHDQAVAISVTCPNEEEFALLLSRFLGDADDFLAMSTGEMAS